MKQLTQQLKSGDIMIQELPWPIVGPGMVLVRNHYLLITHRTEGSIVSIAQKKLGWKGKGTALTGNRCTIKTEGCLGLWGGNEKQSRSS